jgi:hypothetical protein
MYNPYLNVKTSTSRLNLYVILGIAILIFIIIYVIYIGWVRATTSFPGINEISFFNNQPIDGSLSTSASISTSGFNQMIRNGFTFGFTLYLKTPENNYGQERHIVSLLNKTLPVYDPRNNANNNDCMESLRNNNVNVPAVYLSNNGSSLKILINREDGINNIVEIPNISYNKVLPIVIIIGRRHIEIYIEGELHTTQQISKDINIDALKSEDATINVSTCGGFSGYIHNAIIWNDILTPIQVKNYNDSSKVLFEKNGNDNIYDITKGLSVVCGN